MHLRHRTTKLLEGLVAGAARVDLDGKACGEVSAEDAEHAAARLAEILASREAGQALVAASRAARIAKPAAPPPPPPPVPTGATPKGMKDKPVLSVRASAI
jgi:ProP effector